MFNINEILSVTHDNKSGVLTSDFLYRFDKFNLGFTLIINGQNFGHFINCDFLARHSEYDDIICGYEESDFYVCKNNQVICSFNTIFEFNHISYTIEVDDDRYNSYLIKVDTEFWRCD